MMRLRRQFAILAAIMLTVSVACNGSERDDSDPTGISSVPAATLTNGIASTPVNQASSTSTPGPTIGTPPIPTSTASSVAAHPSTSTATIEIPSEGTRIVEIEGHQLSVPAGYSISVFARDIGAARFMALDEDGVVYVTDRRGRVLRLPDANQDGVADRVETVLDGLNGPHGITFYDGDLYVAEETRVVRARDLDGDGSFEAIDVIIDGLPEGGHSTRTLRFGPDGLLYVSVGSSCNVCDEDDPRRAAIWRYNADGSGGEPFAIGLRNAVGMTFDAESGLLWVTNNGRDGMGDDVPPETINQPNAGDDFGWPRCHAGDIIDPQFGSDDACDDVAPPAVLMQAHSAPLGLTFVSGEQLAPFSGDLLVAFHGSWNRSEPTGYKVVRVPFADGVPTGDVVDFVSGWLLPDGDRWARPVDVLIAADGSLLISDDEAGYIFRLARDG